MRKQEAAMKVGIVKHDIYLEHITDDFHPENPNRLVHIYAMLHELGQEGLVYVQPRMATHEEIALNHDASYINFVAETKGKVQRRLDPDTVTSPKSYEAACMAVGGLLQLSDALIAGEIDNGFALVRPPGHHAERDKGMGFCIFNTVAVAARYLIRKHGLKRVFIVDWDLHHGNGTQHSFYRDSDVLYFSTHQYPYYPGTGSYEEIGSGEGKGYTINVPMSYGMGDGDYSYAFEEIVLPVVRQWKPEAILVSAGFDIHHSDPLGGMTVTESGFTKMTRMLMDAAEEVCKGRILFTLEGGYDLSGLTNSVKAVILQLRKTPLYMQEDKASPSGAVTETVRLVKQVLQPYWGEL
jgi:acetoin utilization deacetylase AcuC-like enzyme